MPAFLTEEQQQSFSREGFLVLDNFASQVECSRLRGRINQLVDEYEPGEELAVFTTDQDSRVSDNYFLSSGDKIRFFFEPAAIDSRGNLIQPKALALNKIGHSLHNLDPVFSAFFRQKKMAELCADLGNNHPLLLQSMYIFKQPGFGGEVSIHQDSTFLYTDPPSVIGFWFAMEDATEENGCLWALPGGHQHPIKSRFVRSESGGTQFKIFDEAPFSLDGAVPLPVCTGTLVILHGALPHFSDMNRSESSRQAVTLHIIDETCDYPSDNWLPQDHAKSFGGF